MIRRNSPNLDELFRSFSNFFYFFFVRKREKSQPQSSILDLTSKFRVSVKNLDFYKLASFAVNLIIALFNINQYLLPIYNIVKLTWL